MEDSLVGEKTIAYSIAQEILTTRVDIPPIPDNGRKIIDMVRQPKDQIDIPTFAKLVESDPGLFTRILQLANSIFYSEVDKIVSLRAAITRIGLVETVNSVGFYVFQRMLPKFPDIEGFSYSDFWSHSWACAVANRHLGHPYLEMGVLPGDLYLTGMLQGIGRLLFAIHFPEKFEECIQKAAKFNQPLYRVEKDIFGTTDTLVAARIMSHWNMPDNVCAGVAYSQMPELAPPQHIIIAGLTQFAYYIAGMSGIGKSGDGIKMNLSSAFFGKKTKLKISRPEVQKKFVDKILESLQGKAESVTQAPSADPSGRYDTKRSENGAENGVPPLTDRPKKGVLGWVKSLLTGD